MQAGSPTQATQAAVDTTAPLAAAPEAAATRQQLQLGQLVVRLINIGREPSNTAARLQDFDAAEAAATQSTAGKKVWKCCVTTVCYLGGQDSVRTLRAAQQHAASQLWLLQLPVAGVTAS